MLELISSGKNTQWHTFSSLQTKCSYAHIGNETQDFQFINGRNLFLTINKTGFELIAPLHKNDAADSFCRVKKRLYDNLLCGASTHVNKEEIAFGCSTGHINFFNIRTGEFAAERFIPEKYNVQVIDIAYNSTDEVLASLYSNGDINLYGMNTNVKMDTLKLDNNSKLIRFHPTKQFCLAIGSENGPIHLYDTQLKKVLFHDKIAHTAPCGDLCWFPTTADRLITVGFDCNVNVYDARRKSHVVKFKTKHPLSTVSVSMCEKYCCFGNLKGEILAYDFRQLKIPLASRKAHNESVMRVAFIPTRPDDKSNDVDSIEISATSNQPDNRKSVVQTEEHNDSFSIFLSKCAKLRRSIEPPRDSFSDLLALNHHDASDYNNESRSSLAQKSINDARYKQRSLVPRKSQVTIPEREQIAFKRDRRHCIIPPRVSIAENILKETMSPNVRHELSAVVDEQGEEIESNKENEVVFNQPRDAFSKFPVEDQLTSTPNLFKSTRCDDQCAERLQSMQSDMNALKLQVETMENRIMSTLDEFSFSIHMNLWTMQDLEIKDIKNGVNDVSQTMAAMTRNDEFLLDYIRTKEENQKLKKRLEELSKR